MQQLCSWAREISRVKYGRLKGHFSPYLCKFWLYKYTFTWKPIVKRLKWPCRYDLCMFKAKSADEDRFWKTIIYNVAAQFCNPFFSCSPTLLAHNVLHVSATLSYSNTAKNNDPQFYKIRGLFFERSCFRDWISLYYGYCNIAKHRNWYLISMGQFDV